MPTLIGSYGTVTLSLNVLKCCNNVYVEKLQGRDLTFDELWLRISTKASRTFKKTHRLLNAAKCC